MPRRSSNALRELLEARELIRDKVPDGWFAYPVSRAEAVEQGLKYYFTGEPCSQKHISLRAVNGRNCLECKGYKTIPPPEENLTSDGRNTGGYRHYTSEEDEYLKSNYKIKSKKEMSRELGRSVKSIF